MKSRVEEIAQLMHEARMLNMVRDWRGIMAISPQLNAMLANEPETARELWRELILYHKLHNQIRELKLEELDED